MSFEWPSVKLSELITIKHGFAFKGEYFSDTPTAYQLTTPGNFAIDGGFQLGKGKYYSGPIPEDYILSPGDLIVTMTDLSKAADTLGYAAVVPDTRGSIYLHNQRVGLVQIKSYFKILPNFLHYLMRSDGYRHWIISSASGSTVKHTSPGRICEYQFNLPSVYEQEQIGSILTVFDNQITLLRETNKTLEAIAQAIFKSWFVDFDPVRAKQEGREPEGMDAETAALFPDSFEASELGLIPKGWSICSVYDLAQYINGAAYKAFEPNLERRGLPIIKIAELKAGVTSQTGFSDIKMPLKYKINTQDVLFSWSGNPDTSIDIFVWPHGEAWLNQHIFRVAPKTAQERSFILLTLKYLKPVFAEIARNKQTTGLGHVTVSDLKRLRVIQPNNLLLKKWNELVDPLLERAFMIEQKAQTLTQIRDTLLPRLISGQLRLPDAESMVEEATA